MLYSGSARTLVWILGWSPLIAIGNACLIPLVNFSDCPRKRVGLCCHHLCYRCCVCSWTQCTLFWARRPFSCAARSHCAEGLSWWLSEVEVLVLVSKHSYQDGDLSVAWSAGQLCEGSHHEGVELGSHVCRWLAGRPWGLAVSMWLMEPLCCKCFHWLHPESSFSSWQHITYHIVKEKNEESAHVN